MGDTWKKFWMHSLSKSKYFPSLWEKKISLLPSPDVVEVYTQFIWSVYIIVSPGQCSYPAGSKFSTLDEQKKIAHNTFSWIHKEHKGFFFLQVPEECRSHHWSIIQFFSLLPLIHFPNIDFVLFVQETKKIPSSCSFLFWSMKLPDSPNFFRLKDEYFYFISSSLKYKLRMCSLLWRVSMHHGPKLWYWWITWNPIQVMAVIIV